MDGLNDQPDSGGTITWRTQVELVPDWDGYLTSRIVGAAAANLGEVAAAVDIIVNGRLDGVAPDAMMPLGCYLSAAESIAVVAHGRGVPALREAITHASEQDRRWRADDEKRAQQHDSKPRG